jgi:hypothetical protein
MDAAKDKGAKVVQGNVQRVVYEEGGDHQVKKEFSELSWKRELKMKLRIMLHLKTWLKVKGLIQDTIMLSFILFVTHS